MRINSMYEQPEQDKVYEAYKDEFIKRHYERDYKEFENEVNNGVQKVPIDSEQLQHEIH